MTPVGASPPRRRAVFAVGLVAVAALGFGAALAAIGGEPTVATQTFTNVVTYTVPTVTETVTVSETAAIPPAPPLPTFPRSIWTKSTIPAGQLAPVKSLGFGFVQVDPDLAQLVAVQAAGLRAIVWLGNVSDPPDCTWNWSDDQIRADIARVKDHPAVAYYFVADEPHAACAQQMRERTALVRSLDPTKPTFMTENRKDDFAALAGITDIFGIIRYPCSYTAGCVPSKITESMNAAKAAGITSWWGVPQVFHEPTDGYYRAPSPAELQAIFEAWEADPGTVGYFFYTWGDGCCVNDIGLFDHLELWDSVRVENSG